MPQGACCWVAQFGLFDLLVAKCEGCRLSQLAPRAETCSELPGRKWGHITFWKMCEDQALLLGNERRDKVVYL